MQALREYSAAKAASQTDFCHASRASTMVVHRVIIGLCALQRAIRGDIALPYPGQPLGCQVSLSRQVDGGLSPSMHSIGGIR